MSNTDKPIANGLVALVRDTYANWRNDRTLRLGAGLSYYVVFSLIPTLAISIFFASFLFPKEEVTEFVSEWVVDMLGTTATQVTDFLTQDQVVNTIQSTISSLGLFGIAALIVTASFAMIALMDSVHIIWGRSVKKGLNNMVKRYIFSYVAVLSFSIILIAILSLQALLSAVGGALDIEGSAYEIITNTISSAVLWSLLIVALAWLMRILSNNRVGRAYALIGATVTIFFMYIGVKAIGFYISEFSYRSVTSAFSAVLLVLVWVYYESQILLAGFQLTKTMSRKKYFSRTD